MICRLALGLMCFILGTASSAEACLNSIRPFAAPAPRPEPSVAAAWAIVALLALSGLAVARTRMPAPFLGWACVAWSCAWGLDYFLKDELLSLIPYLAALAPCAVAGVRFVSRCRLPEQPGIWPDDDPSLSLIGSCVAFAALAAVTPQSMGWIALCFLGGMLLHARFIADPAPCPAVSPPAPRGVVPPTQAASGDRRGPCIAPVSRS